MTADQLVAKLKTMLAADKGGEKMMLEVLFGVLFAVDIRRCGITVATLAKGSGRPGSRSGTAASWPSTSRRTITSYGGGARIEPRVR